MTGEILKRFQRVSESRLIRLLEAGVRKVVMATGQANQHFMKLCVLKIVKAAGQLHLLIYCRIALTVLWEFLKKRYFADFEAVIEPFYRDLSCSSIPTSVFTASPQRDRSQFSRGNSAVAAAEDRKRSRTPLAKSVVESCVTETPPQLDRSRLPPTNLVDENWLILLPIGLENIQSVVTALEGTHDRMVFLVLERMGLARFLMDTWRFQDATICGKFVLNWSHKTKTTEVFGIPINADYRNFTFLTGLGSNRTLSNQYHGDIEKRRVVEYLYTATSASLPFALKHDRVLRSVLHLLNNTLWLAEKQETRAPSMDLLYLVIQSMKGVNEYWSKVIYERFVEEMRHLQDNHYNYPQEKLRTLAGPLICFLYCKAKCQYEAWMNGQLFPLREIDPNAAPPRDVVQHLERMGFFEYHGDNLMPLGHGQKSLTAASQTNHVTQKPDNTNEESRFCRLFSSKSADEELQVVTEFKMLERLSQSGVVCKHRLNQNYKEQKGKQEEFKHHLRTCWQEQPRKIPCNYGCCVEAVSSP
ncbi:hypothetical protein R1flu_000910 [Riccia fluitans]|uniref:Uncharacterized protein n=1 Tax=Riccia fluitans TaxID=41844 RepID=A0ABD1Y276_9MARC